VGDLKKKYGSKRRTEISRDAHDLSREELEAHEQIVVTLSRGGYIKRIPASTYRNQHRGGKGVFTIKVTEKTGEMVTLKEVVDEDDIMIITDKGVVIRQSVSRLKTQGRNTQGFRLIKLDADAKVADVARVIKEEE
ncbi:MAG: DNA gyrase subunit A, partial [Bacteroidetes bacterium]|nr:DNA gyrase subunit A [Bacteroidota bacterium]